MSSGREGGQERSAGVYALLVQSNTYKGSPTQKDWLFKRWGSPTKCWTFTQEQLRQREISDHRKKK